MSYQMKRPDVQVVTCDLCADFSWTSDRRWRLMPESSATRAIHLCPRCQPVAVWCAIHQQYHWPDAFHRHACQTCGGLFTSVVRERRDECPTCLRARGATPACTPPPPERPRSWLAALFTSHGHRP